MMNLLLNRIDWSSSLEELSAEEAVNTFLYFLQHGTMYLTQGMKEVIEEKESLRDLGVMMSNSASFNNHINLVCKKKIARRTTGAKSRDFLQEDNKPYKSSTVHKYQQNTFFYLQYNFFNTFLNVLSGKVVRALEKNLTTSKDQSSMDIVKLASLSCSNQA